MKTLQIKLSVTCLFVIASISVNAQSKVVKSTSASDRAEAKKEIKLLNEIPKDKKAVIVESTAAKKRPERPLPVSDYMSMEKRIMSMTIAGDIPAALPKHIEGQTKEEYRLIVKNWAKNNLNLFKKEYHVRILSEKADSK